MSLDCWINGEARSLALEAGACLRSVLEAEGYLQPGVAPRTRIIVARNEQLVPALRWNEEPVMADDRIDIVGAVTGG